MHGDWLLPSRVKKAERLGLAQAQHPFCYILLLKELVVQDQLECKGRGEVLPSGCEERDLLTERYRDDGGHRGGLPAMDCMSVPPFIQCSPHPLRDGIWR